MFNVLKKIEGSSSGDGSTMLKAADYVALTNGGTSASFKLLPDEYGMDYNFYLIGSFIGSTAYTINITSEYDTPSYRIVKEDGTEQVGWTSGQSTFTPPSSGVFIINVNWYGDLQCTATITPTPITTAGIVYETPGMVNKFGKKIYLRSAIAAKIAFPPFNSDDVKILLRGGVIENVAKGKLAGATLLNEGGVTVDGSGNFVCNGSNLLRFTGSGFDFRAGHSWTMDFMFANIGSGRNDFASPYPYKAPALFRNDGDMMPYGPSAGSFRVKVADNSSFLYSVQYNALTDTTCFWLDGVFKYSSNQTSQVWHYGFPTDFMPYQIGKMDGSNAVAHSYKYFRASNVCQYESGKDFTPNLTGF